MKKKFLLFLLHIFLIIGCSTMNDTYQNKLDHNLNMELSDESNKDSEEIIRFVGKCKNEITADMRAEIEQIGVSIESVIKDIFTASGTRKQIIECAKIESVIRLEKSQTIPPLNNAN
ncbi:MAG: hypothetical protein PHW27_06705 [Melioribacteraceae bacterium]|nr:hypothetical protein [Melioribacteraceae bacterium]MDD3558250.1 hypothetical protein [Melioribacteraceae bacterium]